MKKRMKILTIVMFLVYSLILASCDFNALLDKLPFDIPGLEQKEEYSIEFIVEDEFYHLIKIKDGSGITMPEKPYKEGYEFVGWVYSDGKYFNVNDLIDGNITLYAVFEPVQSTESIVYVNFYVDEKLEKTCEFIKNKYFEIVFVPYKEGYSFVGWQDKNGKMYDVYTLVEENVDLYAVFEKKTNNEDTFHVIFKDKFGYYEEFDVTSGKIITFPYTNVSNTFSHWIDQYGNVYYAGKDYVIDRDYTLNAVYEDAVTNVDLYLVNATTGLIMKDCKFVNSGDGEYYLEYVSTANFYFRIQSLDLSISYTEKEYAFGEAAFAANGAIALSKDGTYRIEIKKGLIYVYYESSNNDESHIEDLYFYNNLENTIEEKHKFTYVNKIYSLEIYLTEGTLFTIRDKDRNIRYDEMDLSFYENVMFAAGMIKVTKSGNYLIEIVNDKLNVYYLGEPFVLTPNVPYKLALKQDQLGKTLYFDGKTANRDYYLSTTEDVSKAVDVIPVLVNDGYQLRFVDLYGNTKYIDIISNGPYVNAYLVDTPSGVFTWNEEYKTLIKKINDFDYYIGTYNTYDTISASKFSFISTSYPCYFYPTDELPTPEPESYEVTFYVQALIYDTFVCTKEDNTLLLPEDPYLEGYKFMGWFSNDKQYFTGDKITGSISLYAKFEEDYDLTDFVYQYTGSHIVITGYNGSKSEVVIPASIDGIPVKEIMTSAFKDNMFIETVILPNELKSIGDMAFMGCRNLKNIIIPETVSYIGIESFKSCSSLITITIPGNVSVISSSSFEDCTNLKEVIIEDGVLKIGDIAFSHCTNLETITIPTSVYSIGMGVFYNSPCLRQIFYTGTTENWNNIEIERMENDNLFFANIVYNYHEHNYEVKILIDITWPTPWSVSLACTYDSCTSTTTAGVSSNGYWSEDSVPATCFSEGYKTFVVEARYNGKSYKEEKTFIENKLEHNFVNEKCIVCGTENYTEGLTFELNEDGISYKVVKYIGTSTNVKIPNYYKKLPVTRIETDAFNSTNIRNVKLPETLQTIGFCVFVGCKDLEYVIIPNNVTFMDQPCFDTTFNTNVYFENNTFGLSYDHPSITRYYYSSEQPETEGNYWHYVDGEVVVWDYINSLYFIDQSNGKFDENLKFNGDASYYYLEIELEENTSFHIQNRDGSVKLTEINVYYCEGIDKRIAGSIKTTTKGLYRIEIKVTEVNIYLVSDYSIFEYYDFNEYDNYVELMSYKGPNKVDLVIPSILGYNYYPVTIIGDYAFEGSNFKHITLPNTIEEIKHHAFYSCSNLEYLIIPYNVSKINPSALDTKYPIFFENEEVGKNFTHMNNVYLSSKDRPTTEGNYWYYYYDKPMIWDDANNLYFIDQSNGKFQNDLIFNGDASYYYLEIELEENTSFHIQNRDGSVKFTELNVNYCEGINKQVAGSIITTTRGLYRFEIKGTEVNIYLVRDYSIFEYYDFNEYENYVELMRYKGPSKVDLVIPSNLGENYYPVTIIGDYAFEGTNFKHITLPSTIEEIKHHAFYSCSNLEYLIIPYNASKISSSALDIRYPIFFENEEVGKNFKHMDNVYLLSKDRPTTDGNYWYYYDGKPMIWDDANNLYFIDQSNGNFDENLIFNGDASYYYLEIELEENTSFHIQNRDGSVKLTEINVNYCEGIDKRIAGSIKTTTKGLYRIEIKGTEVNIYLVSDYTKAY